MNQFFIKTFVFLKNSIYFLKIAVVFTFLAYMLYWIQILAGFDWKFLDFIAPLLDFYIRLGSYIFNGTTQILSTIFEHKYFGAIIVIGLLYLFVHILWHIIDFFQSMYEKCVCLIKKYEEKCVNSSLVKTQVSEQQNIKIFQIYVSISVKPQYSGKNCNVDIEEQKQILYKYLIEKTQAMPENYDNGVLFTFSFRDIDKILDIFTKLPESKAPVDYIICVQAKGKSNGEEEKEKLKFLAKLKIYNKIITLADTTYRYNFNENCTYESSQLGVYQKDDVSYTVCQFVKKI